ncbi:MAG: hypothetical protein O2782_23565, partial [bacterium]|nr:hypothetical protein [bacterium]
MPAGLICVLLAGRVQSQAIAVPPAAGLQGETIVTPPAVMDAVLYHVGLVGLLSKTRLTQIEISLSAL